MKGVKKHIYRLYSLHPIFIFTSYLQGSFIYDVSTTPETWTQEDNTEMTDALTSEVADATREQSASIFWINNFIPTLLNSRRGQRFIRFGLSGLTGLFVNMGVLYVLREFGHGLTGSAIIAIELAIINNFFWNDLWTFQDIARQKKGLKERGKRFFKFNLVCLSGLILNVLIINALYNLAGINEYSANLAAIVVVTFWNFWFNLKISWKPPTCKIGKLDITQPQ